MKANHVITGQMYGLRLCLFDRPLVPLSRGLARIGEPPERERDLSGRFRLALFRNTLRQTAYLKLLSSADYYENTKATDEGVRSRIRFPTKPSSTPARS